MFDTLVEQMKTVKNVTEQFKKEKQMERLCRMQNIEARAREFVLNEIFYIRSAQGRDFPCL